MEHLIFLYEITISISYFIIFLLIVEFTINENYLGYFLKELKINKYLSFLIKGIFLSLIIYLMEDVSLNINNSLEKAETLFGI